MEPIIWHVGIDAGGTGTKLLAVHLEDETAIRLEGPGANLQRLGVDGACDVLADLVRLFRDEAGAERAALCAGISGAGRRDEQQSMHEGLTERLLGAAVAPIRIEHDGTIALEGAFEGQSGVITISGTGSLVLARTRDRALLRAGGWGYLLGDDGSGYDLGRAGLRAVAAHYDGGPSTQLAALLAARHGITDNDGLIQRVYRAAWPIQNMAPLVVEAAAAGDSVAQRLVRDAAKALAEQVRWLADREAPIEQRVAPIGGLMNERPYREALYDALRTALPEWTVGPPAHAPEVGAVLLARRAAEAA